MNQRKQILITIILQDLILAIVINIAAAVLAGKFPGIIGFLIGCLEAFTINILAGILIPVEKIGTKAANLINEIANERIASFVRIFVINAIFVTIISFCMTLIHQGFVEDIVKIWLQTYAVLHMVGLITSLLTGPLIAKNVAERYKKQL